jgi:hypothetical protein
VIEKANLRGSKPNALVIFEAETRTKAQTRRMGMQIERA